MTFVSYAQNFEDVILWRSLGDIKNGFYIDIGANDPAIDSVTKAFYDKGWSGINIEPVAEYYAELKKERSRDINLQVAVGASPGEIEIWEWDIRGWATASPEVINKLLGEGHKGIPKRVPCKTLSEICEDQRVRGDIHFLKIDVEGFEDQVIQGMDFKRFRPWILIIEATVPNSNKSNTKGWEDLVVNAAYEFAYFDGLNRFYVATERNTLLQNFKLPPNVFDNFIKADLVASSIKADMAENKCKELEILLISNKRELKDAKRSEIQAYIALDYFFRVLAFHLARPKSYALAKRLLKYLDLLSMLFFKLKRRLMAIGAKLIKRIIWFLKSRPLIYKSILVTSKKLRIYGRLRSLVQGVDISRNKNATLKMDVLSPRAKLIYKKLKNISD
jgi:FkbM family methyltransferase